LQVDGYWNTKKIRNEYLAFEKEQNPDVVYCQMVRTMKWVKKSSKPKLLDFQDCLSKNIERRMYKTKGLLRRILHYEFKMLRSCEYDAFECYDAFTIISSADRDAIPHQKNDTISILPNGVDTALFRPRNIAVEYDILFSGNMHYAPNIDAAVFLIKDIMPIVWQKRPHTTVMLAGADPVPTVKKLQSDKVTVTGWVNDIGECYAKAGLFVAPMRIGTGLQNKLLEAMATKKPCITSPLANNALAAEDGKQVIVAKTAQEYADAIIKLLDNKDEADMLADNAYNYVLQKYSWDKYNELLETLLNDMYNKCNCKQ
jgi:glycosyltransferase involved in cell wall biosynthesis